MVTTEAALENLPVFLHTDTVAELTGLTPKCIRDLCTKGEITAVKLGATWIINRDKLLEKLSVA